MTTGAVFATALVLLGGAYLLWGWGMDLSPHQAQYRFTGYWTQAEGMPLDQPYGIAVDPRNGNVLVTDAANQRVVVFDPSGRVVRTFGQNGDGPGQFALPTGVAVGPQGHIYVADYNQDRIQKFTENGEYLLEWGDSGSGETRFNSPNGLAVDTNGDIYVADFYNKVIKVFGPDGAYLRQVGHPGHWRLGALDYPTDVDTAEGRVLVADAYNYRVQLFGADGRARAAWGWHALWLWPLPWDGTGGFGEATGATFGAGQPWTHVADARNYRVVMLDERGRFVTDYTLAHRRGGPFAPMQLAVSPDGQRVYATDLANDRVIILSVREAS
ncbi:NHL repeat containing protein [Salinisphaera sp. PC39]